LEIVIDDNLVGRARFLRRLRLKEIQGNIISM
jgi:hypothetical protein